MQRDIDGMQAYFIVNNDRENGCMLEVALEGGVKDGAAGGVGPADRRSPYPSGRSAAAGCCTSNADFGPAGSRLYVVDPKGTRAEESSAQAFPQEETWRPRPGESVQFIGPLTDFTRTDPNVLTLDMCQYRLEDGAWSAQMEVWRAQDAAREALGMRPNYYNGLPQRYRWALQPHPNDGSPLQLRFTFTCPRCASQNPVYLLLEAAERFTIQAQRQTVRRPWRAGTWTGLSESAPAAA